MEKLYKPVQLYLLKTLGLSGAVIGGFVFIYFFYALLTSNLPLILIIIINVIFGIFCLIAILFIILNLLNGKPTIKISEEYIQLKSIRIPFKNILEYKKAKGGSEPEIVTEDRTYILELSWFKKKDRKEIEEVILQKLSK